MPAYADRPQWTLNIFRAKADIEGGSELLKDVGAYKPFRVNNSQGFLGVLFLKSARRAPARWIGFFHGALDETPKPAAVATSSPSAVLLIERSDRTFALTFGYGRGMLAEGSVEERFGLFATLNAIDPDKIRSVDRTRFEQVQRVTRDQVSRDSSLGAFGLDVEQDLVRAVTGVPKEHTHGSRLTGRDALSAHVRVDLDSLPKLLDTYSELADKEDYKERFGWIDNIAEVSDALLRDHLDAELVGRINRLEVDAIWLAPPDLLEWDSVSHFVYRTTKSAGEYPHLDLDDYFREVRRHQYVRQKHLTYDRIRCLSSDGQELRGWNLKTCLCAEVVEGDERYILSEGKWYRVDEEFVQRVVTSVAAIGPSSVALPDFDDDDEKSYNRRAADDIDALFLMDRVPVPTGMPYGAIEFCDLFDVDRRMIHVKRYGASSVLSHLFAQGVTAARLYHSDRLFRATVNSKLPASHQLGDPGLAIVPSDYEVAYVVVSKQGERDNIPFFSMVNLKGHHDLLREIGFVVTLTYVANRREV